jgi:hypothetical protein
MKDAASVIERIRIEDEAEAEKLRTLWIPQRAGMAVGARMMAEDLARHAIERLDALRRDGTVATRLASVTRPIDGNSPSALVEPVLGMLHDELTLVLGRIRMRGAEWLNASLRLEGKLHALEQRGLRLDAIEQSLAMEA